MQPQESLRSRSAQKNAPFTAPVVAVFFDETDWCAALCGIVLAVCEVSWLRGLAVGFRPHTARPRDPATAKPRLYSALQVRPDEEAMIKTIDDAVAFVRSKTSIQPQAGVILG